ncbi:MAG TPA: cellulase family glycosylhydrolase, partial [Polyangiaceae bacterium]|nr:cellulase family glycosylhydrolase [Polyangiaceae bacterium]
MTPETPVETFALAPLAPHGAHRLRLALALSLCACAPTANSPPAAVPAPSAASAAPNAPAAPAAAEAAPIHSLDTSAPAPLVSVSSTSAAAPAPSNTAEVPAPWWDAPYPKPFDPARLAKRLAPIHVDGNHFADETGKTFVFEGVSIADPDLLIRRGHWDRGLFEAIASWGANIVRVPVHPAAFHGRGAQSYFELLDQAVIWANELGMYIIVDWHSIGNLGAELFQHPMYDTTRGETYQFWRSVAFRYQHVPTVALYELFNEPTVFNGKLGAIPWTDWKRINEELIDILRAYNPDAIPLVAGFDW